MIWYMVSGILLLTVAALVLYANRGLARINRRDDGLEKEVNVAFMVTSVAWPISGATGLALVIQPLIVSWLTA